MALRSPPKKVTVFSIGSFRTTSLKAALPLFPTIMVYGMACPASVTLIDDVNLDTIIEAGASKVMSLVALTVPAVEPSGFVPLTFTVLRSTPSAEVLPLLSISLCLTV
ncbi:MAG: hypothetical protein EOP51_18040 [Sphingobacteriales bacterium]|nr:MAG: hypothetical protein EOP51_18040 [Sphingobacteriales bacterium]